MLDVKKFSGVMDTDSGEDYILPASHKYALNGRFYGTQAGMRFQNVMGNTQIPNVNLPDTGVNETIGAFFDQQKIRIFYFNYNSGRKHGIYVYDIKAGTTTTLLQCLSGNCPTDILNFNLLEVIVSVNIIYGDSQQGDILYFIDTLFRPTKININRALANGYGTYQRSYLDVIKEIPQLPPVARYEDDNTVTVNNLNGQLFQFKIRNHFDDNDMSATSAWGVMPLPQGDGDPALSSDATVNAVIKIIIPTGAPNVKKLEILGTTSLGQTWGDFFSIEILNKADLSIPDNDTYIYEFRNDRIYAPIDINESNQLFDVVPRNANTQDVLLTNILIYGGITENYKPINPTVGFSSSINAPADIRLGLIAVQEGNTLGTSGNIHISVVGKAAIPENTKYANITANVNTTAGNITYTSGNYTSSIPTTNDIILGLTISAVSFGFTVVSVDSHNLIIFKASTGLNYFNIANNYEPDSLLSDSIPTYDYSNQETFGLVFFDAQGRSIGIMPNTNQTITTTTLYYNSDGIHSQPYILFNISGLPPDWAYYYQLARIANPTKSKFLYWISDRAFTGTDTISGVTYAYLSIASLNQYTKDNPSTATQLSYTWQAGDRVKILENMQSTTVFNTQNDYQIINGLNNPTINGVTYDGQFLQILVPSSGSGITIDNSKANFNFLLEIYTPTKSLSSTENIYYEFGRRYAIGNPTTPNRYYQGEIANQSPGGVGSATIKNADGDAYMRARTINAGNTLNYLLPPTTLDFSGGNLYTLPETFSETFTTFDYTPNSTTLATYSASTSNTWLNIFTLGLSFHVKGSLTFEVTANGRFALDIREYFPTVPTTNGFTIYTSGSVISGQTVTANLDFVYTPTPTAVPNYMAITIDNLTTGVNLKLLGGNLTFVESGSEFTANIVDQNFSDFYPSAVNSNGRAWAIQPNIDETYIGTLVRYSLPYLSNTNINNVNRFYEQNSDQYDDARGDIRRLRVRGAYMRVFQDRGCGEVPVFQNMLTNTSGQTQIGQSENVINNIQYYAGEFGMGGQYSSLVSGKIQDYFVDPVRGYQVRVSQDGIIPISELYYGQYYIRSLLTPYNKPYTRQDGGSAKILGCYYFFDEEAMVLLQGGTNGSNTINNYLFSFNEKRNGYSSFFDYANAEFILCAEDVIYTWKGGLLYIHNNTTNYCQFFGQNKNCDIQVVFNENLFEKKTWESIAELCDDIMECPDIYTNIPIGSDVQRSSIPLDYFPKVSLEGMPSTNFLRASNSDGGLTNGQTLKGNTITVTFRKVNAQKLINLSGFYIKAIDSPLTPTK